MEFVSYIETRKGKKLLKVFKSKRAVDMFLKKNTDKILSKSGIESVGSMSKRDWDSKEAKYAVKEVGKGSNWAEKYVNDTNLYKKLNWYMKMGKGVEKKIKGKEFVIMSDGSALIWNAKTSDWELYKPKRIDKKTGKPIYESVNEGKKRYYQQDRVGSAKYTISYHDGKKKHKDGSDFFDIQTFRNKKDLAKFVNTLHKGGYVYGFNESVNETKYKVGDTLAEGLINPKSGHEYFQLTKNTPVKYIAGHSGLGLTTPGVLLKNIPGFIDGKKGAYLIDYHGALFYVDLKKKVAVRLGYDLSKQPKLRYKTNFIRVPQAPEFSDWKRYLKESEDGVPQGYNPMVESKTKESKVIQKIHTYTKTEKKFYDELAKHEVRIGQNDYAKFIINALRGFGINPREFKRIPDAEEKLYQIVSK